MVVMGDRILRTGGDGRGPSSDISAFSKTTSNFGPGKKNNAYRTARHNSIETGDTRSEFSQFNSIKKSGDAISRNRSVNKGHTMMNPR